MAAVHDLDRELREALHRRDVRVDVGVGAAVEERTVVDGVAGEQRAGCRVEQADRVGRVTGQVHHLERDVAEVDDVAVVEHARRCTLLHHVGGRVVVGFGQRVEEILGELVPGRLVHRDQVGREVVAPQRTPDPARCREIRTPGLVRESLGELVQRTRVIEVVVRRERERRLLEEIARGFVQARDAEPGVDEQRAVAAAHEPDVAARERIGERLPEPPDHVTDPFARTSSRSQLSRARNSHLAPSSGSAAPRV